MNPKKAYLHDIERKVVYGNARGYEQYYIDKYNTLTGIRKKKISSTNRGNKNNSFRKTRTDNRAKWFKAAYECLARRDAKRPSQNGINGGSGCQK